MSARSTCQAVEAVAPDVALGLLSGAERSVTLAHLERCGRCRALVDDLARVVDGVLLLAPGAEPPEGFECRVLDAVAAVATGPSRPSHATGNGTGPGVRRRFRIAASAVAAAVLAILAALAFGSLAGDGSPAPGIVSVMMSTPGGREVGEAYLREGLEEGEPSWIFVSVPNWRVWEDEDDGDDLPSGSGEPAAEMGTGYRVRLELAGGGREELEIPSLAAGGGSWGSTVDVDLDLERVLTVAVVGEDGRVWCEGARPRS